MITKKEFNKARKRAIHYLEKCKIVLTKEEKNNIEVAEFGLNDLYNIGLQILVYINNDRYCAKELVLFPRQSCPEHRHPEINGQEGKQETFRCRYGIVYLYIPGKETKKIKAKSPKGREKYFTTRKEIILKPGEQYTLPPNTLHWFQAGDKGAVVSEFSSKSVDEKDVFTDPDIKRFSKII